MPEALILKITPAERDRLLRFLDRAQLTGVEVPAFVRVRNLLASARPSPASLSPQPPENTSHVSP